MENTPQHQESTGPTQHIQPTPVAAETIIVNPSALLPQPSFWARNKANIIAGVLALVILGGAGYYFYSSKSGNGAVAVVNGTKITEKEFTDSVTLIEQDAMMRGIDVSSESVQIEIRNQALETLINNTLILTGAAKASIVASEEDIQKTYDQLATQNGGVEQLAARMAEVGLTEEKLRKNIADRILADRFMEQETDIEALVVSEEEIKAYFEEIKKGNPEGSVLPPFEQLKPQLESQLLLEKQQQIMTDFIAKLRSEAKIEMKI